MLKNNSIEASNQPGVSAESILAVQHVTKKFDAIVALNDLTFEVRPHEILGIAGPNGAGKSTLLNVCSGALAPNAGRIVFDGQRVEGLPPHRMCQKGVGRTFQIPQVFESLSVEENVRIGGMFGASQKTQHGAAPPPSIGSILEMTTLTRHRNLPAGKADLLTRKLTMLSAVIATQPKLVFMDEPLAGLNTTETDRFSSLIAQLHGRLGIPFVIVEHKIRALSSLSDRLMIIHFGSCICLDIPEVVVKDQQVIDVYLGLEYNA